MYKIKTKTEGEIATFPTYIEALAYCECFDYVRMNPDGTFSPMHIEGRRI